MIEFENLKLRKLTYNDKFSLSKNANNYDIWLNLTDSFPHPYTLEDAEKFIEHCNDNSKNIHFCIDIENEVIGMISLYFQSKNRFKTGEVGYWLAQKFWGQGIMPKILKLFINYSFKNYDLERMEAIVYEWNKASMKVLEKNGFKLEGIAKNSAIKNNKLIDEYKFAILKNEVNN